MPASVPVASVPPSTAVFPDACEAAEPAVSVPVPEVPVCAPLAEPPAEVVVSPAVVPASV